MKTMHIQEEAARCLLCADAPCSKACKHSDPARAIRAVRFGNEALARQWVAGADEAELEAAEAACIHYDRPIRIREMAKVLPAQDGSDRKSLPSLAIDFCGIRCENPFFL
ncbi:MAG: NAD-dependent dihydropyrimidine dehydrogenase subunit PreA, partial [Bacteroidales bacterium]|nr:NAD-dependent dihydropyrimidine dehydrogenase subunit PreA [Bacteroidales bacterium]